MRHFVDDDYDPMAEYEAHCGGLHYEPDEEGHGMMWREEYQQDIEDYDKSTIQHFKD